MEPHTLVILITSVVAPNVSNVNAMSVLYEAADLNRGRHSIIAHFAADRDFNTLGLFKQKPQTNHRHFHLSLIFTY